jgi:hypothetical protein
MNLENRKAGRKPMKQMLNKLFVAVLIAGVVGLFGGCIAYSKARYHRKYPNTTTLDWILDGKR